MSATEGYGVMRVMRTLELLAEGPCSSAEIAQASGMHQRTARRVLARLIDEGYVARVAKPQAHYVITPRFRLLAGRALLAPRPSNSHDARRPW